MTNSGVLTLAPSGGDAILAYTLTIGQPSPQIMVATNSAPILQFTVLNADGSPYALTDASFVAATDSVPATNVIDYDGVSVSGSVATITLSETDTGTAQQLNYALWDTDADYPFPWGYLVIQDVPKWS
jgi:hypothetical protein